MLFQYFSALQPPEINRILVPYIKLYEKLNNIRCQQIGSDINIGNFSELKPEIAAKAEEIKGNLTRMFQKKLKTLISSDAKKHKNSPSQKKRIEHFQIQNRNIQKLFGRKNNLETKLEDFYTS